MGLFNHPLANRATDRDGNPLSGAIRRIYPMGYISPAQVFSDPDLTVMQTSDSRSGADGFFDLSYLVDGFYRAEILDPQDLKGPPILEVTDIEVGSPGAQIAPGTYPSLEALAADTLLSYDIERGRLKVGVGSLLRLEGPDILMRVAERDAPNAHVITAGGVRLFEAGARYTTQARFVDAVARGEHFEPGTTVTAGGDVFLFTDDGAQDLPDLPGWSVLVGPGSGEDLSPITAKTDLLTVTQPIDLDAQALATAQATAKTDLIRVTNPVDLDALSADAVTDLSPITAKTDLLTVTQPVDLDAQALATAQATAKTDLITVTEPINLDALETGGGGTSSLPATWFADVAALLADTGSHAAGHLLAAQEEAFVYRVAASDATDHHVTTAGGVKLYVQPKDGAYFLAAWGVDGTGATSARDAFLAAMQLAIAEDAALVLTQNEILIDGGRLFIGIERGKVCRLRSPNGTVVRTTTANISFRGAGSVLPQETLTADVDRHATQTKVSNTSRIKVDDLVYFTNEQARIDSNWNYVKYAVRRVQAVIDAETIELDQPMDMQFHQWEGNRNGRRITSITQANPGVVTTNQAHGLSSGDRIRIRYMTGMAELQEVLLRANVTSATTFELQDEDQNPYDTSTLSAYSGSAEVFLQGQSAIEVFDSGTVDLDNINFLVAVEKIAIADIDITTGVITTVVPHGLVTGEIINFHDIGGTAELNDNDYEVVPTSATTFTLRDFEDVAIDTTGMTAYTGGGHIHKSAGEYESTIGFSRVRGRVTRCSFVGVIPGWLEGTVDTVRATAADDLHLDHCHFERGRYCPLIQAGARNVRVTNFTAKKIRHIDPAGWAQDTLIGPGVGIDTDCLIQSHPCIRPTWRGVRDSVRHSVNSAIDLRGVGETVEDCQSWATSGVGVGTQEFRPVPEYQDWAASFTRRVSGFESRTGCISSSFNSPMIVERCNVPFISTGGSGPVFVDEYTKTSTMPPRSEETAMPQIVMTHRVDLPKISAYATQRRAVAITGITQANPAVVTAPSHGIGTGEWVVLEAVAGMTEVNGNAYRVTVIDEDTFSINANASRFGAYTSGGEVWINASIRDITDITQANPAVVTANGHGFSDGDVIWLSGVSGMRQVNHAYYMVDAATANTFSLNTLAGMPLDSTGFAAYTSGGKATRQALFDTIDFATKPNVGIRRLGMTSTTLFSENAHSARNIRVPFQMRFQPPGAIQPGAYYHTQITLKAMTRGGYAESRYNLVMDNGNGASNYNFVALDETVGMGGASVHLQGLDVRGMARVGNEGEGSTTPSLQPVVNERWGVVAVADVLLDSSADYLVSLDVDLDVRMR